MFKKLLNFDFDFEFKFEFKKDTIKRAKDFRAMNFEHFCHEYKLQYFKNLYDAIAPFSEGRCYVRGYNDVSPYESFQKTAVFPYKDSTTSKTSDSARDEFYRFKSEVVFSNNNYSIIAPKNRYLFDDITAYAKWDGYDFYRFFKCEELYAGFDTVRNMFVIIPKTRDYRYRILAYFRDGVFVDTYNRPVNMVDFFKNNLDIMEFFEHNLPYIPSRDETEDSATLKTYFRLLRLYITKGVHTSASLVNFLQR